MSAKSILGAAGFALGPLNPIGLLGGGAGLVAGGMIDDAKAAREKQDKLEKQRRDELATEAAARDAAKRRAETAGQRVGRRAPSFLSSLGFSGQATSAGGLGKGTLFGN